MKYLVIVAKFNELITRSLLDGATQTLRDHGVRESDVRVIHVPGAFDIPVVASVAAKSGKCSAIICLGAVIRGGTPHFDYVAGQAAAGLMKISVDSGVPVVFGILTTDTVEQALDRAGLKHGNKGRDAALTALEMVRTLAALGET